MSLLRNVGALNLVSKKQKDFFKDIILINYSILN